MFTFSAVPNSRGKNLGEIKGEEVWAEFFIEVDTAALPMEKIKKMTLKRGQAEFHDAYILHHSDENNSNRFSLYLRCFEISVLFSRRRCAWIVRYIPDYVAIPEGSWRKTFKDNYQLIRLN